MASRFVSKSLFNGQRSLATQAATAKKTSSGGNAQMTQLPSGVTVASLDTGSAVSSVAILVKAGSRQETLDNSGVTHALRLAANLSNAKETQINTTRSIQQIGGKVDVVGSREYTLYTSQAPRNSIGEVVGHLAAIVDSPNYKTWEVSDQVTPRITQEVVDLGPATLANELLHQASYREGLGNSIYSPEFMVGQHGPAMLTEFQNKNYTSDRVFVIGLDVDHDQALKCGEALGLTKGSGGGSGPSKFLGGIDSRKALGGNYAALAVASSAAPASNLKEAMATRLLQYVLGFGPKIKRGNGTGQLQKALSKISGVTASAINYSYSDAGLLGAMIMAESHVAGQALDTVVAALRSVNVTEAELNAAKKALTIDLVDQTAGEAIETIATNLSLGAKEVLTPSQMANMFANVSLADVQAVSKKLANAKFSMGAVGNLSTVPYIDQL